MRGTPLQAPRMILPHEILGSIVDSPDYASCQPVVRQTDCKNLRGLQRQQSSRECSTALSMRGHSQSSALPGGRGRRMLPCHCDLFTNFWTSSRRSSSSVYARLSNTGIAASGLPKRTIATPSLSRSDRTTLVPGRSLSHSS